MNQTYEQLKASPRSFQEDYELENGNYLRNCVCCGEDFIGYKRRVTCKICQIPRTTELTEKEIEDCKKVFKEAGM
jgi:hypothetical protein